MSSWSAAAIFVALLATITVIWIFRRRRSVQLSREERAWRTAQKTRLRSLSARMAAEAKFVRPAYPDLPRVPIAGLLAPPRYIEREPR